MGKLGRMMLCPMKGMQPFVDTSGYVLCRDWQVVGRTAAWY